MHISALILALLSATTLAVPRSGVAPPATQPSISPGSQPTAPPKKSLGARLASFPTYTCGKDGSASWDGRFTDVVPGCVKFAPRHEYVRLELEFGVLEVFPDENCTGKREMKIVSKKEGSNECHKKGENHWGSVRLSVPKRRDGA